MAHSIELLLDPDSDAAVRRMWAALLSDDLPSQGAHRSNSNRPHITLIAAARIDAGVDAVVGELADRFPLTVDVGATVVFRGRRATVARLVVANRELLALHRDLHHLAAPFVDGDVVDHCTRITGHRISRWHGGFPTTSSADASRSPTTRVRARRWDGDHHRVAAVGR
ncbi:2'-5' RNA ligase family protein [Williamsia herbipolensis]|uniref:2'-5' RNA ligase family protein n=1 Tax=Williamsia herbipolensis TaxID=1603258 RepID=UPI001237891D|nr:2'-5' RNA ligase family protein [Williamsia herbipolensis]